MQWRIIPLCLFFIALRYSSLSLAYLTNKREPLLFTLAASHWPSAVGTFLLIAAQVLLLLLAACYLSRGKSRFPFWVAVAAFAVFFFAGNGAFLYYSFFNEYPGSEVLRLFILEEESLLYLQAPYLATYSFFWIFVSVSQVALAVLAFRFLIHYATWTKRTPVVGLTAVFLAVVAYQGFLFPLHQSANFRFVRHTFPELAVLDVLLSEDSSISTEELERLIPPKLELPNSPVPISRVEHVLLIVLECVRPDYLPFYRTSEQTMPRLFRNGDDWTVFPQAYAHGPDSETSIPVLMSSRYEAAFRRPTSTIGQVWGALRSAGVRTAFLSAGSLTWGGLRGRLGLGGPNLSIGRGELSESEKHQPDRAVIDRWKVFFKENDAYQTFSTIHLVGTHFPYEGAPASEGGIEVNDLKGSYRQAIEKVDTEIARILSFLQEQEALTNSVVIMTSDHGEGLGDNGSLFHGTSLEEPVIRVPILMRVGENYREIEEALKHHREEVRGHIDLLPTVLHLLGIPEIENLHGTSLFFPKERKFETLLGPKFFGLTDGKVKVVFDRRTNIITQERVDQGESHARAHLKSVQDVCDVIWFASTVGFSLVQKDQCRPSLSTASEDRKQIAEVQRYTGLDSESQYLTSPPELLE